MTSEKFCENCGVTLRAEASFCKSCGASVRPVNDMKCPTCGNDNPPDAQYCGECDTSLSEPPVTGSTPYEMTAEGQEDAPPAAIPVDSVVVRQSSWAYMLPAVPWMVIFVVSLAFDFFSFGLLPAVFATFWIGSRYLSFRRTSYIITDRHIIILLGSPMGQNRTDLPFGVLNEVLVQPGTFGKTLGYTRVRLELKDDQMVLLNYVPLKSPLLEHLRERMNS